MRPPRSDGRADDTLSALVGVPRPRGARSDLEARTPFPGPEFGAEACFRGCALAPPCETRHRLQRQHRNQDDGVSFKSEAEALTPPPPGSCISSLVRPGRLGTPRVGRVVSRSSTCANSLVA